LVRPRQASCPRPDRVPCREPASRIGCERSAPGERRAQHETLPAFAGARGRRVHASYTEGTAAVARLESAATNTRKSRKRRSHTIRPKVERRRRRAQTQRGFGRPGTHDDVSGAGSKVKRRVGDGALAAHCAVARTTR
jgi:hypothetical protein